MPEMKEQLTVDSILETLRAEGYQITKRTFQYYVQAGLLPKGIRKGAASGGVRFYYPVSVIATIRLIFTLKARGFKLNEIRELVLVDRAGQPVPAMDHDPLATTTDQPRELGKKRSEAAFGSELFDSQEDLYVRVMRMTPGGERLRLCLQCGTCGGSCPSANEMDHTPRKLFALLQAGFYEEVLTSSTAWFCISCYYCTVRCPQQIPITEIMYTLKELARRAGVVTITHAYEVSRIYLNLLEKYGRSFDMGYAFRYHLTNNHKGKATWGSLAVKHDRKESIIAGPSRIKQIDQLQRIIDKAKSIGDQE
jgi:heterodisulfide reductase subunit C